MCQNTPNCQGLGFVLCSWCILFTDENRELHLQYNETINSGNDTVNAENDTVFNLIKQNNKITSVEISETLKVSLSTAKRKIKELKKRGKIERIGSDKNGHWKVL